MGAKPVTALTPDDLARFPVWEYDNGGEAVPGRDETWVLPVTALPVSSLSGRVVGVALQLGGRKEVGLLGNLDLSNPQAAQEFTTLSVWRDGTWFHLARYFDYDRDQHGPAKLAAFLGLSIAEVFPVRYDLSGIAVGHPKVVRGCIDAEPAVRLTASQRMALILGQ
jgi:hypothetical protein